MKKIFRTLAIVAVAALGFACQNDIDEQVNGNEGNTVTVEVVADAGTRSSFVEKDGDSYPSTWNAGDNVVFYLNDAAEGTTKNVAADGETAVFEVTFDDDEITEGAIYAFAPKSISGAGGFGVKEADYVSVVVPAYQTPQAGTPDKAAHLLVGKKGYTGGIPTNVNMVFDHAVAYGKMTLKMDEGVKAESVTITFPQAVAGANCQYDHKGNGGWSDADVNAITLSGTQDIYWFGIVPTGVMTSGNVVVEVAANNNTTYIKTIELNDSKKLGFEQGKVSSFTVNMTTNDVKIMAEAWTLVEDASTLNVGDQVVIAAADYSYAMSTTQNDNNRGQATITKSGETITLTNDVAIFTLEEGTVANTWAFNNGSGKYLYAASSSKNYLRTGTKDDNASFAITITEGVTSVIAQGSNSRNWLRYNSTNTPPIFSCYASGQMDICLYKQGLTVTEKPKALRNAKFTPASVDVVRGLESAFEAPTLTFDGEGEVTYAVTSGNAEIVEGEVVIGEFTKNGTITISATIAENNEYQAYVATYTINLIVPTITLSESTLAWEATDTTEQNVTVTENTYDAEIAIEAVPEGFTAEIVDGVIVVAPAGENNGAENLTGELSVRYTVGTYSATTNIALTQGKPGAANAVYKKVTEAPNDWSGTYLIVCEDSNVAFNGSLTTLDAVSNTVAVSITNSEIAPTATIDAATFTINASGHIKSASGYYIGQTSNANGLKSNTSTTYTNTLSINNDGTVNVVSGGAYLRYNAASGNYRFRYYKSSSYTAQKAICLYKLVEE